MKDFRIAIIEDSEELRSSWTTFLSGRKNVKQVFCAESVEEALGNSELIKAEIILLDIELPGITGIEGIPMILEANPKALIIIISVHDDDNSIFEAIKCGAVGFFQKNISPLHLYEGILSALQGGSPLSPFIANKLVRFFMKESKAKIDLSDRELEVLKLLSEGASYKSISETLFLSLDGVRYHIRNIYYKLQVNNKTKAIRKAMRERLI